MKKKIFVAGIYQESNSFSPLMSEQKDFLTYLKGEELTSQTPGVKELEDAGYEVIPGLCASAWPGGILKLEDYRRMVGEILEQLPLDGSLSGILFPSHGALEVEFIGSGDAFLISMLRERVAPGFRLPWRWIFMPITPILSQGCRISSTDIGPRLTSTSKRPAYGPQSF